MEKRTLTAQEVSEYFFSGEVSYWTVLKMAKVGELPHFKVGSRYLFNRASLMNWQAAQEQRCSLVVEAM